MAANRKLRVLFTLILIFMLVVTSWASWREPLWNAVPRLLSDPWAIASLADAYSGFLTFYTWVHYKEGPGGNRLLWLGLILVLGNIAMAAYVLLTLASLPAGAGMRELLLRKEERAT